MQSYDNTNEIRFRRVVEQIDKLPSLPSIATRLIDVVNSPVSSAEDAAELIQNDPGLTTKILRLANSAFYGMPRSVSSVSSAVVILGFNTLRSVALSAAIMNMFDPSDGAFDYKRFWRHSAVCAMNAKSIAKKNMGLLLVDPEGAFCMGILHDIGKLIFARFFPAEYAVAQQYALTHKVTTLQAEIKTLGVSHTQIGATLADKWALPIDVEKVLVHHHDPKETQTASELVNLVHVADNLCHQIGLDVFGGETAHDVDDTSLKILGIRQEDYPEYVEIARQNLQISGEFLSIMGDG
ncbi:MAG: HDOD domain-containing protein [Chitinivibrionales bacterium]